MKSEDATRTVQNPLSEGTLTLRLNYRVPSLNRLFAMSHWQRLSEKKAARLALASASSSFVSAADSKIPTTVA
jgi:hypothetical protein